MGYKYTATRALPTEVINSDPQQIDVMYKEALRDLVDQAEAADIDENEPDPPGSMMYVTVTVYVP